jgi:probable F420-dependent oxidoreductase
MRIGAVLPQTEIGSSAPVIREYARAVEDMGFTHILAYDHVLGVSTTTRPDWEGPYTSESAFHEVFVLFGYLAAVTERIELVTGVLVLPRRQTALVAKQAAEVDVLSGRRLRLGIGVGWHEAEFEGSGMSFHDRGVRSEEQIQVLRALWREHSITYAGRWHSIEAAGINPLPVRRSIPIWLGGGAEATLRRVARLGDGWIPELYPTDRARSMLERLHDYAREAGRDPDALGIEARLDLVDVPEEAGWRRIAEGWRALGATHLCVNTMGLGLPSPDAHIALLRRVKAVLGDLGAWERIRTLRT